MVIVVKKITLPSRAKCAAVMNRSMMRITRGRVFLQPYHHGNRRGLPAKNSARWRVRGHSFCGDAPFGMMRLNVHELAATCTPPARTNGAGAESSVSVCSRTTVNRPGCEPIVTPVDERASRGALQRIGSFQRARTLGNARGRAWANRSGWSGSNAATGKCRLPF